MTETAANSTVQNSSASVDRASDWEGIEIHVIPDEIELPLAAKRSEKADGLRSPWHLVSPAVGSLVSLWSQEDQLRIVRLTVESEALGWNPRWPRWSFALRQTPKDLGGDALAAQDELSGDESALVLLMLPGERRQAILEFEAEMDGFAYPGDFSFDVVLTDTETGGATRYPGLLRLRHPNSALLAQLPALYTESPSPISYRAPYEDRPFFERYLRGFDDALEPTQEMLANLALFFDPDETASDVLPWLSTWVSLVLDENWPQLKRRRLIKEAVELYRWRGTRWGLSRYLELYTGILPEINDQPFTGMRLGPGALLGRSTVLGDVPPHTFVLTLAVTGPNQVNEQSVHEIIQASKPAHAAYELRIVERE